MIQRDNDWHPSDGSARGYLRDAAASHVPLVRERHLSLEVLLVWMSEYVLRMSYVVVSFPMPLPASPAPGKCQQGRVSSAQHSDFHMETFNAVKAPWACRSLMKKS